MVSEKSLDYVQASISISEHELSLKNVQAIAPMRFYKRGYIDENKTRYYFGNPNSKKALFIASGQALENMRNEGYSDENILTGVFAQGAKVTRLDLAATQYGEDDMCNLEYVMSMFKQGKIKSPLVERGAKLVSSFDREDEILPETFYIGDLEKRGKKGIFRAYDKGFQLNISRYLMFRLELEERGENANASANRIAQGASVASVFRSRFDIEDERWQKMMNADSVKIERGKAKSDIEDPNEKRWKWLIEQVAPTLEKALRNEPMDISESENFAKFCAASGLGEKIRQLSLHMSGK